MFEETDSREGLFSSVTVSDEKEMLQEIASVSMQRLSGLDSAPAFHLRRVENKGTGLSAVIFRVHHVIGDGISLT